MRPAAIAGVVRSAQFLAKMRDLLKLDGRPLMHPDDRGRVRMKAAKEKASVEVKAFKERVRLEREIAGERALRDLSEKVKKAAR